MRKIISALLVGSTFLATKYILDASKAVQQRQLKKQRKEAIQTWEDEGGAIVSTPKS
jgi:hypothetical protein